MEYDEFDAEYRRVLDGAAGLSAEALAAEVDRLRALSVRISDPADRRDADNDIASLASVLTVEHLPTSSPAELEAGRVHSRAIAEGGTTGERIARAQAGMAEISRIAAAADPAERAGTIELNESLAMLVRALKPDS